MKLNVLVLLSVHVLTSGWVLPPPAAFRKSEFCPYYARFCEETCCLLPITSRGAIPFSLAHSVFRYAAGVFLRATSEELINAARDAEAKHGKGSPEALVAWTEVEEVNAAATPDMSSLDDECDITSTSCEEYQQKMAELETLLEQQKGTFTRMKRLAEEVKAVPDAVK